MGSLIETKAEYDGFEVEYEVISDIGTRVKDKHREEINHELCRYIGLCYIRM